MIILYSMVMIQLPELVGKILTDLSAVGIQTAIEHQYALPAQQCTIPDPDRIAKVLTVFFIQLESALQGNSCTLQWDYRERTLSATLQGKFPKEMDTLFSRTRTSLHCIGGTLTVEQKGCFLALPLDMIFSLPNRPEKDSLTAYSVAPPLKPSKEPFENLSESPLEAIQLDRQNPVFDPAVLQQACPDQEFSQQLMEEFLYHCEVLLLELEHLITQGEDLVKIHRIAHSIKGGGLNIGAFRLSEVARWMEQQAKAGTVEGLLIALNHLKDEERLLAYEYREHYGREANPSGRG